MRITFEAVNIRDLVLQMEQLIASVSPAIKLHVAPRDPDPVTVPKAIVQQDIVRMDRQVDKPVDKPVEKKARTEKQLANDEKMRAAALARVAARRAAKAAVSEVKTPMNEADGDTYAEQFVKETAPQPFAEPDEEVDPAEMVKVRIKTIEELQAAYANGHQKEVFELLSRFGNGAKSFRELPPESFMPIRKAIDLGALE